ncbi:GNAT family N-acetyltransferase [Bacteroidales bacterium OttesenSCG-928-B11]|nr:GNAT family N-acetyltransferase [Bacteroidales bacterium OttesenSCG-928-B11]MDL2326429.1 GNAT family N-acetyltransferase [Bacteroidales bacterium OttesenSCG-928-A14]
MEIRWATHCDIPAAKKLMQDVFHDNDLFLNIFFDCFFDHNLLLGIKNDQVVSMAFLLPAQMIIHQKNTNISYLYACATAESERGNGWMRAIIDHAWDTSCRNGEAGLFLLPAEKSLYDYYAKLDFHDFFYYDEDIYDFNNNISESSPCFQLAPLNAEQYNHHRRQLLKTEYAIHYPTRHFQFAEKENTNPDAGFYQLSLHGESAIFYGIIENNHLNIGELLGSIDSNAIAPFLSHHFQVTQITLIKPGHSHKSAMLRPAKGYEFLIGGKGYFNWGGNE